MVGREDGKNVEGQQSGMWKPEGCMKVNVK